MKIVNGIFSGILGFLLTVTLIILGGIITLDNTVLNPAFVISEMEKSDAYPLISNQVSVQLKDQLPTEVPYIEEKIDETITELEPWLREHVNLVIYEGLAYLKGEQNLHIVILLDEVRNCIKGKVEEVVLESPPPELEGLPPDMVQALLSQIYIEIDNQVPEQIKINETFLGAEVTAQLHQAQQIVGYIMVSYKVLFGLIALLIVFIALLQWWKLKPIALYTGIPFITAGAFTLVATLISGSLIPGLLPPETPVDITSILPAIASDLFHPLRIYGIIILVTGIALTLLSIKLKTEDYPG